jgi:hypothetical protein
MAFSVRAPAPCARVQGRRVVRNSRTVRPVVATNVTTAFHQATFSGVQSTRRAVRQGVVCMAKKSVGDLTKADLEVRLRENFQVLTERNVACEC